MIFTNINIYTILFVLILGLLAGYFYLRLFQRDIHRKQIGILFAIFLLVLVCFLGPKGGMKANVVTTVGSNIAFVVDVSKSMDALDFGQQDISRLQMSKNIISNYMLSRPNNRYALDVFSGNAIKILPFTDDISIYQTFLSGVNESNVGESGTDILKAIYSAVSHFTEETQGGLIVLFTDGGEDKIPNIGDIKNELDQKNIRLIIAGIGSTDGSYIPVGTDFFGRVMYKTYQGEKVLTQLNALELSNIAKQLGEYIQIELNGDIEIISDLIDDQSDKNTFENNIEQRRNLTSFFILIGFLLWFSFLINILLSKYRKNK